MALFAGLSRAHGTYDLSNPTVDEKGKVKGKALSVSKPVTVELWERHLSGHKLGLGIVPIREDSTCVWGAIDVDIYPMELPDVEIKVKEAELPLVVCRSKSGGAQLYLFTQTPVTATLMVDKLGEFRKALGFPADTEIFPKQKKISSDADFGNWMNMPFHKMAMSTRYCVLDGRAISASRFLDYAEHRKVDELTLKRLTPKVIKASGSSSGNSGTGVDVTDFSDAPPCLEYLTKHGFPEGSRNNALFSMGVFARGAHPDDWEAKIHEFNQTYMGPGTFQEVQGVIKSLMKKGYVYKCSDAPLASHCNKPECHKRTFGIPKRGRPAGSKESDGPCILLTVDRPIHVYRPPEGSGDEPQWVFSIAGKNLSVSLDMLMDQGRFLREYLKRFERMLMQVPYAKWVEAVNELLEEAETFELPHDAGPEGQLMLHLEAFCTGKASARDQSELLTGKPWTDPEGLTWFRSKDFVKYLDQNHFREFKQKELYAIFRSKGGKYDKLMIKGKCVSVWAIPAFAKQVEELDEVVIPINQGDSPF
jgi:hypothetical protein